MAKKKWYGVARGKKKGVYDQWFGPGGAKEQIDGYKGALYRGFPSYEEAASFVKSGQAKSGGEKRGFEKIEPDDTRVVVYTDGGCINNPGPGGYGAVILFKDGKEELSGGRRHTTNNRMELLACIKALEFLINEKREIVLHTDSSYIVNAVNKGWLKSWVSRGWKKSDGGDVLNQDLWQEMIRYISQLNIKLVWVKGHAGIEHNERCDELANSNARNGSGERDVWFEENK